MILIVREYLIGSNFDFISLFLLGFKMGKDRDRNKAKYNNMYKTIIPFQEKYYDTCFYCGERQDVYDHYPSLKSMESIYGIFRGDCLLIPSCRSCNSFLSDTYHDSIDERIEDLKKRIYKKENKSIINGFKWTPEEIDELSRGHLLDMVVKLKYKSTVMIERLNYKPYDFYIMVEGRKKKYIIDPMVANKYSYLVDAIDDHSENLEKVFRKYLLKSI